MKSESDYLMKWLVVLSVLILMVLPVKKVHAESVIKVGVLQYVEHVSLNETYRGFVDGLKEGGYVEGENLKLDFLNAAADNANLQSMGERLVNNNDYLFAIATPAAQALVNIAEDKTVYFSAVTDPVGAGLVQSLEAPGKNVTGTTDAAPIDQQVKLIKVVAPTAKKVGIIYNSGETNSLSEVEKASILLKEAGYEVTEATVTSTNDISQVVGALLPTIDVLFTVTDNTVASAMTLVGDLAIAAKVPVIGGSQDMIEENGLVTYGLNYYNLGKQTGLMLAQQIKEQHVAKEMPVQSAKENNLIINEKVAEKLGIDPKTIKVE